MEENLGKTNAIKSGITQNAKECGFINAMSASLSRLAPDKNSK